MNLLKKAFVFLLAAVLCLSLTAEAAATLLIKETG